MTVAGTFFVIIFGFLGIALAVYYSFMSWRYPKKLQESQLKHMDNVQKHPLYGISRAWVKSESWIWSVRLGSVFIFLVSLVALVFALLSLVELIGKL